MDIPNDILSDEEYVRFQFAWNIAHGWLFRSGKIEAWKWLHAELGTDWQEDQRKVKYEYVKLRIIK